MQSEKNLKMENTSTEEKMAKLYQEFRTPLFRYILARVSHREVTEDIISTVFIRFFKYLATKEDATEHHYKGLLYTIAKGEIIDHYQQQQKNIPVDLEEVDVVDEAALTAQDEVDQNISIATMYSAIRELSPEYQELIRLRHLQQLDYKEIAVILKKSEATIRVGVHRALKILKDLATSKNTQQREK